MADDNTKAPVAAAANEAAARAQGSQEQRGPRGSRRGQGQDRGPRRDGGRPGAPAEEKLFDERVLHIDRVARVVKGGRRFRFRALVVVGDAKKNKVGIGSAKGADVTAAVTKATDIAKKKLVQLTLKNGTLYHESQAKVGGANILVKPASAGTGLIAGGVVRTILEVAGVTDALSKSLGSTNKTNTAYATLEALRVIVPSSEWTTTKATAGSEKPAAAKKPAKKAEEKK